MKVNVNSRMLQKAEKIASRYLKRKDRKSEPLLKWKKCVSLSSRPSKVYLKFVSNV